MEEKKKSNVAKIIFRVIGIILSIVLIPALIVWVPAGGVVIGVSDSVSKENLKSVIMEANLSDSLLDIAEEEIVKEISSKELKTEFLQDAVLGGISKEWIDGIIEGVFDAAYEGTRPEISITPIKEKMQSSVEEIGKNGFRDLYSAWKDGTPSVYFEEEFVQNFWTEAEAKIVGEYEDYQAESLEDLEEKYDAYYGQGEFSKLLDEKILSFEDEWNRMFDEEVNSEFSAMITDVEQNVVGEINDEIYKAFQEPELRGALDMLKEANQKSGTLKWIVYGVMFGAILILVACFWFGVSGFVVTAIPMLIGGILCKVAGGLSATAVKFVTDTISKEPELQEFSPTIGDMSAKLINPLLGEISKMGNVALITAVVLIGLAILRGVIKKNSAVEE